MEDKKGGTRKRMKINVGRMTGGGERLRTMQSKGQTKGVDIYRNEIKGAQKDRKERKDTVNIHRRTQKGRSHNVPQQNPGKASNLGLVQFIY